MEIISHEFINEELFYLIKENENKWIKWNEINDNNLINLYWKKSKMNFYLPNNIYNINILEGNFNLNEIIYAVQIFPQNEIHLYSSKIIKKINPSKLIDFYLKYFS